MPLDDFKPGMCGLSVFVGFPGLWEFRILNVGGKKEMTSWLKTQFLSLTADPTDKFLGENKIEDKRENEDKKENEELLVLRRSPRKFEKSDVTPRKRQVHVEQSEGLALSLAHSPRKSGKSEVTPKKRHVEKSEGSPKSARSPQKLLKFEGIDDGQYLNRIDLKKKDLYKEKLEKLEEDVKSLRRKNRKLEERVCQLERNSSVASSQTSQTPASPQTSQTPASPRTSQTPASPQTSQTPASPQTSQTPASPRTSQTPASPQASQAVGQWTPTAKKECMPRNEQQPTEDVDKSLLDEETLIKSVKGVFGDQNVMKHLCLQIFTEEDMINSTRTGKRTAKAMDNVKPSLDPIKFNMLETVIMKVTSFDKATFYKKFENQQKMLRRAKKQ